MTLQPYLQYKFLWADNKLEQITEFLESKPGIVQILSMFEDYDRLKDEILRFPRVLIVPPLELDISKLRFDHLNVVICLN